MKYNNIFNNRGVNTSELPGDNDDHKIIHGVVNSRNVSLKINKNNDDSYEFHEVGKNSSILDDYLIGINNFRKDLLEACNKAVINNGNNFNTSNYFEKEEKCVGPYVVFDNSNNLMSIFNKDKNIINYYLGENSDEREISEDELSYVYTQLFHDMIKKNVINFFENHSNNNMHKLMNDINHYFVINNYEIKVNNEYVFGAIKKNGAVVHNKMRLVLVEKNSGQIIGISFANKGELTDLSVAELTRIHIGNALVTIDALICDIKNLYNKHYS